MDAVEPAAFPNATEGPSNGSRREFEFQGRTAISALNFTTNVHKINPCDEQVVLTGLQKPRSRSKRDFSRRFEREIEFLYGERVELCFIDVSIPFR